MSSVNQTREALRQAVNASEIVVAPGVVDALTARLVQQAGFPAVYATGAGIVNSQFAMPDLGLATMTEIREQVRRIVSAVDLPVIADIDTGFGNPVNVYRTIREFDHAGVAAVQLEDQVSPKKCGHFAGKQTVPAAEMVAKIQIAREAAGDSGLLIIARTDAIATEGFEPALERARRYRDAGADILFVEAPESIDQLERVPREVDAPVLVNMTEGGKTPLLTARELQQMGYNLVIFPNALMRIAAYAVREALDQMKQNGGTGELLGSMLTWGERQSLVDIERFEALERTFVTGIEPESQGGQVEAGND